MRLGPALRTMLTPGLALGFQHHFHGPPIDYLGLAAAAAASWIGVPGPGEPVLIAAGVFAARHRLDIGSVLLIAWASATAGGIAGWLIGMKLGRTVLTAPGPLRTKRISALNRGDEVFGRYPMVAVLLTPSWIAGIHRVRTVPFLIANTAGAALWAVGIGLGAFLVGPPVIEFVDNLGVITVVGLVALIGVGVALEISRRRRQAARRESEQRPRPGERLS